jgi:hypothetical protein
MVAALGLTAVALAGALLGYLSWLFATLLFVPAGGAAVWLWRRGKPAAEEQALPQVEGGLRMVEKPLPAGRPRLPYGLRLTISTEVSVALGLRVVSDNQVPEVEALAQTGRGPSARQGVPAAVRESRQAWLFVLRNSPGERELFLRVDLFAAQPFKITRVEQIRAGVAVALPEWKELGTALATPPEDPAAEAPAAASADNASPTAPAADPAS